MNSLRVINDILDLHFNLNFNNKFDPSYLATFQTKKLALNCAESLYKAFYNLDGDFKIYCWSKIKGLCNFDMVMGMCAYVSEKYDKCGRTLTVSHIKDNDKLLRQYIYFYMNETHKQKFIQKIKQTGDNHFRGYCESEKSDDDCAVVVEEFEFGGTTYLKDDDGYIYKNDLINVEYLGKWNKEKKCFVFWQKGFVRLSHWFDTTREGIITIHK